ncbi:RNA polymerase sigma factor [Pedosphaera parvula]|uniref:RNA polymerase, sigma-24 subunit, ECF subfamily n=1 Tax=Pedosphaera parvula (strain Ellin514) TaxID=320771 RepID=B9XEX3_PEDPL|nr:sigma-70 family RNA polymerase sigma factor [Pedosphaera parvula]EEF61471.1 RNA polymerase, sigma-24 subunit, ECF subfamily [Pedosphaera parvula Ellin514]
MPEMNDIDLLRQYASSKSEEAFSALVSRHINLVYSAAMRYVGNQSQAEEITQAVFIILAKKAASLSSGTILSGWLFKTARLTAANYLRTEIRRSRREQEAYMQSNLHETESEAWKQIAPLLDDAIAELGETDRNALVLRFVEGKDLKQVGAALGTTEEAAKKRVSRAVDKLRGLFSRKDITLSAAALSAAIAAHSIQAAPAGLVASVTTGAITGTAVTTTTLSLVKGTLKLMAWTKVKIAAGVAVTAMMAYQWHENYTQKQELHTVQEQLHQREQELKTQKDTLAILQAERSEMAEKMHAAQVEKAKLIGGKKAAVAAATAAAKASLASGSNGSFGGMLSKMMSDPGMKEFMKQQSLSALRIQYGQLVKQLNLSPEETDKFYQILGDNALTGIERTSAVMKGDVDRTVAKQEIDEDQKQLKEKIKGLLGEDGFKQYEDYKESVPAQTSLNLYKGQLTENSLSDEQSARLLDIMKREGKQVTKLDNTSLSLSGGAMDTYLKQQSESNQRIFQQSADFLKPEQLAALGKFQTNMLNMTKAAMSMSKQFMGDAK